MPAILAAAVLAMLPLSMPDAWTVLSYRGIGPNQVALSEEGLRIDVAKSAGPVVHRLERPMAIIGVKARGRVIGLLRTDAARQGTDGHDDFALRIGLVEAGDRRPTFVERLLAPGWLRHLFSLAAPGTGVRQIRFFNLGLAESQVGWTRRHPLSDLILEEVVAAPEADGRFNLDFTIDPITALGVWLAADGDDTGSSFRVHLEELTLVSAPAP